MLWPESQATWILIKRLTNDFLSSQFVCSPLAWMFHSTILNLDEKVARKDVFPYEVSYGTTSSFEELLQNKKFCLNAPQKYSSLGHRNRKLSIIENYDGGLPTEPTFVWYDNKTLAYLPDKTNQKFLLWYIIIRLSWT